MCAHREPLGDVAELYVCMHCIVMYALFLFIVIQDSFIIIIGIIDIYYYLEFYIKEFDIIHRTSHSALFEIILVFSYFKNVKSACCLGEIHFQNALNLLKPFRFC